MRKTPNGSIFSGVGRWVFSALLGLVLVSTAAAVFPPHPLFSTNAAITGQLLAGEGGAVVNLGGTLDYFTSTNRYFLWNTTNRWLVINQATDTNLYSDASTYANRLTNDWADTDPAEISAAYNFDAVRSFFKTVYGLDGYDGSGSLLKINVHALTGESAPVFLGGEFWVDDGGFFGYGPAGVLDLCGTAYADAFIRSRFDGYSLYPEGFHISFCNILAFLAEYHLQTNNLSAYPSVTPGQSDWYIGEDMTEWFDAIYDMRDPANGAVEIPRVVNVEDATFDEQANSGIQDKFFYYLCMGGSAPVGTNTIELQGVGIDAAGWIAYRALTRYFGSYMSFLNARRAWVLAAGDSDFAGLTTNAVQTAMLAWEVLGVPDPGMIIYPTSGFVAGGEYPFGPLAPTQKEYYVFNEATNNHDWAVSSSVPWIVVSPETMSIPTGTLFKFAFTNVNVSYAQSDVLALGEGYHTSTIVFTNLTVSNAYFRNVTIGAVRNYRPSPAVYSWRVPSSAPTYLPLSEDQVAGPFSVPFANGWRFFAERRNQFYIGANGVMGINPAGLDGKFNSFFPATDGPNGVVAPLWDDWVPANSSTAIFYFVRGSAPNREWVVTWEDLYHIANVAARASFQVVIKEAPTNQNNEILFQYRTVTDDGEFGAGRSATVGIEDRFGFVGGMYSSNGTRWITGQRAILYSTNPPPDTLNPTGLIDLESVSLASSSIVYVVRFSESVTNLTLSDFFLTGTATAGGAVTDLEGAGMVYRVTVRGLAPYGTVSVGIWSGAVRDEEGNPNLAEVGPFDYTMPVQSKNPADEFDVNNEFWNKPVTNYANALRDVWQRGVVPSTNLPGFAYQGSQAWMAVVTNDDFFPIPQDAWFESAEYQVGDYPVVRFSIWYNTESRLTVEAYDGNTWLNVTPADQWKGWVNADPGDALTGNSYYWFPMQLALDPEVFGNRKIRVRFRLVGYDEPGIRAAIDSFQVVDALNPGVYVIDYAPTNLAPSSVETINYTIYNSYTTTVSAAVGLRSISDPGVTQLDPIRQVYGDLPAGGTQAATVDLQVGALSQLQGNPVRLLHTVTNGSGRVGADVLDFMVLGATNPVGVCRLSAKGGVVTNWLGQPLYGDGLLYSCIYQVIDAGDDRVISPPTTNGTPTGDDQLLYLVSPLGLSSFGRIGDAAASDAGLFEGYTELFYPIPTNRLVYARAWDSDNFGTAIAYGDSSLVVLATNGSQTVDFGDWVVGTTINPDQDTDGDSILDGYAVAHGIDARWTVEPLQSGMDFQQVIGSGGTGPEQFRFPARVITAERLLFVLDNINNRVQVLDSVTFTNIYSYTNGFSQPLGMAMDPRPGVNRLAIADTGNDRIRVMEFNPQTGTNWTWLFDIGSRGSAGGQFYKPSGLAISSSGSFYVADTRPDWDEGNSRVSVFTQSGVFSSIASGYPSVNRPHDTAVTPGGLLCIANTDNHRIRAGWSLGGGGTDAPADFNFPKGVQNGIGDRIFVADTLNHRIKVYSLQGDLLMVAGVAGAGPGQLNTPWDVWPSTNDNRIFVADTANDRIQIFKTRIDVDLDGMDDVWEDAVGLDSTVDDALAPWGIDNLSNIGAFRLGLQPGQGLEPNEGPTTRMPLVISYVASKVTHLGWNATNQGVYRVETSTNPAPLPTNHWLTVPGPLVTSLLNGVVIWTNPVAVTNSPQFWRIQWINAP